MSLYATVLLEVLRVVTALVVGVSTIGGIWDAVRGLRAKRAARRHIAEQHDTMLASLIEQARRRSLKDSEIERARARIQRYINDLPDDEAALVGKGLSQLSKSSERRYVQELLGVRSV
ncbi:hypothetical protein [Sinorhizobium terangae]|uniref:hypothetical protein n=1 Tax=Sinorhizobium terangae TaxID=110322 RepID=UPI0024B1E23D|nr:hypothetical protein [Sinorhizobium terangae]WFU49147.1 hypothetical protein QA637_07045 [Sinorhizobium terangae]